MTSSTDLENELQISSWHFEINATGEIIELHSFIVNTLWLLSKKLLGHLFRASLLISVFATWKPEMSLRLELQVANIFFVLLEIEIKILGFLPKRKQRSKA